jgi:hypothetical protein
VSQIHRYFNRYFGRLARMFSRQAKQTHLHIQSVVCEPGSVEGGTKLGKGLRSQERLHLHR